MSHILWRQAYVAIHDGDPSAAIKAGEEGRDLADEVGDRFVSRMCRYWGLGTAQFMRGELAKASRTVPRAHGRGAGGSRVGHASRLPGPPGPHPGVDGRHRRCARGGERRPGIGFRTRGFRGPINWYRSIDRGIERTRQLEGTKIMQPSHFMIGSLDPMNVLLSDALANLEQNAPNLRGNVVLEGAGHWLPLERPQEVNAALLDFLAGLESAPQSASITKGSQPKWPARTGGFAPPLNQIAFSVVDLRLTERWFREGFGLLPAGGSRALMRGPLAANVQGLPRAASTCWWLLGRNSWFQLELFQFDRPIAKLMPADFRPCDIGYTRIGIWVEDFDATLKRLAGLGSQPLTAPQGERGRRRACVRNPDGVYVEIMEDDPLPQFNRRGRVDCPSAIRSVTLSVPQLSDAAAFFEKGIGLKASTVALHTPEHEALWGLAGATTQSRLFDGGEVLIEVVQYLDPAGRPRPHDYRLSDQGILNIAFGARRKADFDAVYRRAEAFGAQPNCRPVHLPGAGSVVYVNDPHGFSVEILRTTPGLADRIFGFEPRPIHKRPDPDTRRIEHRISDQRTGRQSVGRNHRSRHHGPVDRFRPGHGAQGRLRHSATAPVPNA